MNKGWTFLGLLAVLALFFANLWIVLNVGFAPLNALAVVADGGCAVFLFYLLVKE